MSPYIAYIFSAVFLLGVVSGMAVMKFSDLPVTPEPRKIRARKPDPVQQELEETQEWLGVMRDTTADSLDLVRYRYKWKTNVKLAIEGVTQRLAITPKPHKSYEMARIARYMHNRPKTIQGKRELAARRRQ